MAARTHIQHARQDQRGASSERFAVQEALPPGHRKNPDPNGKVDDIVYREDPHFIIDRDEMNLDNDDQLWTIEDHNGDLDSSDDDWNANHFSLYGPRYPQRPQARVDWEPPAPPQDPRPHQAPLGLTLTEKARTELIIQQIVETARPDQTTVTQDTAGAGSSTWNNQPWYANNQSSQSSDWYARPRWNEPGTDESWQSQRSWWSQQDHHWQAPNQWY